VSRIGRKPVPIVKGVKIDRKDGRFTIIGPKGQLSANIPASIGVEVKDSEIVLTRSSDVKAQKALHGTWRAHIANMMRGVTDGFQRKLEIVGVGYKAEVKGKKLQLTLGYSHPILFAPPAEVKIEAPTPTSIVISGIDRQLLGQIAAKIRSFRPPEPYKGKGVKYSDEKISLKEAKKK
jgi:large subunit ribosomal protein L6